MIDVSWIYWIPLHKSLRIFATFCVPRQSILRKYPVRFKRIVFHKEVETENYSSVVSQFKNSVLKLPFSRKKPLHYSDALSILSLCLLIIYLQRLSSFWYSSHWDLYRSWIKVIQWIPTKTLVNWRWWHVIDSDQYFDNWKKGQ